MVSQGSVQTLHKDGFFDEPVVAISRLLKHTWRICLRGIQPYMGPKPASLVPVLVKYF